MKALEFSEYIHVCEHSAILSMCNFENLHWINENVMENFALVPYFLNLLIQLQIGKPITCQKLRHFKRSVIGDKLMTASLFCIQVNFTNSWFVKASANTNCKNNGSHSRWVATVSKTSSYRCLLSDRSHSRIRNFSRLP